MVRTEKRRSLDLRNMRFGTALRGYDRDEVDAFMAFAAEQYDAAQQEIRELEQELERLRPLVGQTMATDRQASETLTDAQRAAERSHQAAAREAGGVVREAEAQAAQILRPSLDRLEALLRSIEQLRARRREVVGTLESSVAESRETLASLRAPRADTTQPEAVQSRGAAQLPPEAAAPGRPHRIERPSTTPVTAPAAAARQPLLAAPVPVSPGAVSRPADEPAVSLDLDGSSQPSGGRRVLVAVLVGLAVVVGAGYAAFTVWGPREPRPAATQQTVSPPAAAARPAAPASAPATVEPEVSPEAGTRTASPVPAPAAALRVTLSFERACWLRATVDGEQVLERLVPQGEELVLEGNEAVVLRAGDAGAVRVRVNGADQGVLGADGQVVSRRFTAPAR